MTLPPWLEDTYASLVAADAAERLPHAMLVHGASGWGEMVLANNLALYLIQRDAEDAALVAHPDLRWVAPEGAGEQIKIDAVREVAQFMVQTPQIAGRKVVVLAGAETMNAHSANALLKMLEEPPPESYLILVTAALSEMLPTIRSRCRLVTIRPGEASAAAAWVAKHHVSANTAELTALRFEFGGAPYALLAALEREERPISQVLADVAARRAEPIELAEQWHRAGAIDVVDRWMRYLPAILGARFAAPDEHARALSALLSSAPSDAVLRFWRALVTARALLRGTTNSNGRLLLEALLLDWRDLARPV